jgi:hypothetical protein
MTSREKLLLGARLSVLIWLAASLPAYAYVDPGSGSVIVTTILGFLAAIGYTLRKYFYRLRRMLTGRKAEAEDDMPA